MLAIFGFSILVALSAAAPIRYGFNDAVPSTEAALKEAPPTPSSTPRHRRHFPILEALYQTFEAYDLTLESTYDAEYDQLRDGSGWPYSAGSGALMYVEQVSKSKVQKRGRDWIIEDPGVRGRQYRGAEEPSNEEDQPIAD